MTDQAGGVDRTYVDDQCYGALSQFLNQLKENICESLKGATGETSQAVQQTKAKCKSLMQTLQSRDFNRAKVEELLQKTTHLVLDFTYVDETVLVDEEFPQDTCWTRINNITELLSEISRVAQQCKPSQSVSEILGVELVECIHWRKGALLYMYCHTLQSQGRVKPEAEQYKKCLEDGINHLEAMLKMRQPSTSDHLAPDDTLQLLNQGIFSDTHLLAMIYAGEMCYWHCRMQDMGLFHQDKQNDSFSACQRGLKHLNSYLSAVTGPLRALSLTWDTVKAESYVKYLSGGRQQN